MSLNPPSKHFGRASLETKEVHPSELFRISRFNSGEPYFGKSRGNRFDANHAKKTDRYGTCYFGFNVHVAFAETVLHNEVANPKHGGFRIACSEFDRYVCTFDGAPLKVAILHGVPLKTIGGDGSLSTVTPYSLPQQWSRAVHDHGAGVDGFLYISRHVNTEEALVVFERAKKKIKLKEAVKFLDYPGAARVLADFRVHPI